MKKSRGIITLIVTAVLIAGLGFVAVYGVDSAHHGSARNIKRGLDLAGGVSITYQVKGDEEPSSEDMSDTVYKLQKRVEQQNYSTESQVYQEGSNRINVEIPGVSNAEEVLERLGQPGSLLFILEYDDAGNLNYTQGLNVTDDGGYEFVYTLARSMEEIEASGSVVITGTDVKGAEARYVTDNLTGANNVVVDLTLTDDGAEKFAVATEKAAGRWSIGIYYDGGFISVPSVNSVISDGRAQISGGAMDFEEASQLASYIRIGGLKLELEELSSNVVGAQLGEKAIETSLYAGAIGLVLVIIFMIAVYRIPGVASGLALILYVIMTLLCLNVLNLTLTLPGIAGIILSIGMAVDANVIIFARIKEEIATGKTVKSAINIGFKKALSAIVDGNVTTLIAAVVLMAMGTGPVKGFAQTLALGIVLSMFTALVITKQILNAFFAVGLKSEKLYGRAKERKSVNFLQKKVIFFAISGVVIVLGFVFMGVNKGMNGNAMNFGLEFSGGTTFQASMPRDYTLEEIDEQIKPAIAEVIGDNNIQAAKIRESVATEDMHTISIKTRTLDEDTRAQVMEVLQNEFGVTQEVEYQNISATISKEMRSDAVVAVVIATICMLFYIWFRFKDVRFAASAVIALVHDVLVVLAFYAVTRISVGNTFIACMLTIVGYSINATIVIFDRVRENLKTEGPRADVAEIVNRSITQTLTRSIYTSLTTFIMVLVLFIMGVSSIRDFALPLMAGIICGAYSSVCITGALWYVMRTKIKGSAKED
ncbi:MAG: protein translocase subunit SecD [Clostridium sp.]|nr:protein translocase subunit SecD [Clostridium sp.]